MSPFFLCYWLQLAERGREQDEEKESESVGSCFLIFRGIQIWEQKADGLRNKAVYFIRIGNINVCEDAVSEVQYLSLLILSSWPGSREAGTYFFPRMILLFALIKGRSLYWYPVSLAFYSRFYLLAYNNCFVQAAKTVIKGHPISSWQIS